MMKHNLANTQLYKYSSLKIFFVLIALLGISFLNSCKDNPVDDNLHCPGFDIVSEPPYDSPIWHPSGEFIGFNHSPLINITYPYGENCLGEQHFNRNLSGFWLINPDGTNMRRIFPYKLQCPAWSPDGQWIAFNLGTQIFKMRFTGDAFDTTSLTQLTTEGRNFLPAWSPDGQWIAYDSNNESPNGMYFIWIMKSNDSSKVRIAYEPSIGEIRMPSWSPDSRKIVHIRYVNKGFPEIFLMDTNGTHPTRLTVNNSDDRFPVYSPNGTKIAFWSNDNICLMDSVGNNKQQLTISGVDASGLPFSWSPDGVNIVYTDYRPNDWSYNNGTLWILNPSTGEKRQLTFNVNENRR